MQKLRCQINTSIKQSLKLRVEELQQMHVTIESILEAGVIVFEKKIEKNKQKSPSGLS